MESHVTLSLRPVIRQLRWLMGSSDARDCDDDDGAADVASGGARRWVVVSWVEWLRCCCSLVRSHWMMLSSMRLTSDVENSRVLLDGSRGPPACSTRSAPIWHGDGVLNLTLLSGAK